METLEDDNEAIKFANWILINGYDTTWDDAGEDMKWIDSNGDEMYSTNSLYKMYEEYKKELIEVSKSEQKINIKH